MVRVSYMTWSEWAQDDGMGIPSNSARIREWLGAESPVMFGVQDTAKVAEIGSETQAADAISPLEGDQRWANLHELHSLHRHDKVMDFPLVALFPLEARECDALRRAIAGDHLANVFVLLWGDEPLIEAYLHAIGAEHLSEPAAPAPLPAAVLAAGSMIEAADYKALAHGRGKDSVVQLVRAFRDAGYDLTTSDWLRAYFAAGGSFANAPDLQRLASEVLRGTRHRVKQAYRSDILAIIEGRQA